jgi:ABC-type molybdate transport system ATPase subunit
MTRWQIDGLAGKQLRNLTATFDPGLHVILALDAVGVDEIIPLLDGSTAARRGRALLDGQSPYRVPQLRRHIGSLWGTESLPVAPNVRESLRRLRLATGLIGSVERRLVDLGLGSVLERAPAEVEPELIRAVATAVALEKPDPASLLVQEPLVAATPEVSRWLTETLMARSATIPVIVVTASPNTALKFGSHLAELGGGFYRRVPPPNAPRRALRVAGANLRGLAAAIVQSKHVQTVRMTHHHDAYEELWIETADPQAASLEVVASALSSGARIWTLDAGAT